MAAAAREAAMYRDIPSPPQQLPQQHHHQHQYTLHDPDEPASIQPPPTPTQRQTQTTNPQHSFYSQSEARPNLHSPFTQSTNSPTNPQYANSSRLSDFYTSSTPTSDSGRYYTTNSPYQYRSSPAQSPTTPRRLNPSAQDQLDRLAEEGSQEAEGLTGATLHDSPPRSASSESPTSPSARSASAPSRTSSKNSLNGPTRLQQLLPEVPEDDFYNPLKSPGPFARAPPPTPMAGAHPLAGTYPPRSDSIDSAMSHSSHATNHTTTTGLTHSSSTASNSSTLKGATANAGTSPAEIAALISAAGSPEALIQFLLKDKHSLTSQNTQLWRLVDKQRAMILGLNKDLERALKEKDRYKKKLKDSLSAIPPVPQPTPAVESFQQADQMSPVPSEATANSPHDEPEDSPMRSQSLPSLHTPPLTLAPYPITPPGPTTPQPLNAPAHSMPSPSAHAAPHTPESGKFPEPPTGNVQIPRREETTPRTAVPSRKPVPEREATPIRLDTDVPRSPRSPRHAPNDSVDSPISPMTKRGDSRMAGLPSLLTTNLQPGSNRPTPVRKAPPTPLELVNSNIRPSFSKPAGKEIDEDEESDAGSVEEIVYDRKESRDDKPVRRSPGSADSDDEGSMLHTPEDKKGPSLVAPEKKTDWGQSPATAGLDRKADWGYNTREQMREPPQSATFAPRSDLPTPKSAPILDRDEFYNTKVPPSLAKRLISAPPLSPGLPRSPRPQDRPLQDPRISAQLSPRYVTVPPGSPKPGLPASPRIGVQPPPDSPRFNPNAAEKKPGSALASPPMTQGSFGTHLTVGRGENQGPISGPVISAPFAFSRTPLTASTLADIEPRVVSSRMRPSRASFLPGMKSRQPDHGSVFTLGVFQIRDKKEIWRVEKNVDSLTMLDARLRAAPSALTEFTARLPDRSLFSGHSPARIDARRIAIDEYFSAVMATYLDEYATMALCEFLNSDVVESGPEVAAKDGSLTTTNEDGKPVKEGYLTKRGKNFGGWKARYFVLDGPVFRYYEAPGGAHLGSIKLSLAQIGIQSQQAVQNLESEGDTENQYRHAFLVLEPKRKDSSSLVRHVLCAESDSERDEWVEALMKYVDTSKLNNAEEAPPKVSPQDLAPNAGQKKKKITKPKERHSPAEEHSGKAPDGSSLRGFSYDQVSQGSVPHAGRGPTPDLRDQERERSTPTPPGSINTSSSTSTAMERKNISAPSNGGIISDLAAWGNKMTASNGDSKKKKSIWGFNRQQSSNGDGDLPAPVKLPASRIVFGAPLEDAIALTKPAETDIEIPAVVYRCIEYLDAKDAVNEEGIFRLSGSNVVIRTLRDRFNTESDVNLLASEEYYDVHAVAGLLKLYLRELPTNILTTERRDDFVRCADMDDKERRNQALNNLVHSLPRANFILLRVLASHLLQIVDNSDINKMTVRNVGIVFSPTLNIPAQLFSIFLQDYKAVFSRRGRGSSDPERKDSVNSLASTSTTATNATMDPRPSMSSLRHEVRQPPSPTQTRPTTSGTTTSSTSLTTPDSDLPPPRLPSSDRPDSRQRNGNGSGPDYRTAMAAQQREQAAYQAAQMQQMSMGHRDHINNPPSTHPTNPSHPNHAAFMAQLRNGGGRQNGGYEMAPAPLQIQKKKRESGMLGVLGGMGGLRKSVLPTGKYQQGTRGMVAEDSVYD